MQLTVVNLDGARFDCTYGRGCDGVCCRNGRPPVFPEEAARIDGMLERVRPLLRPDARTAVQRNGYLSRRRKAGQRLLRVVGGWCVFFNRGCILHRLGEAQGAPRGFKPWMCAVFPLAKDHRDRWYVRQKGYYGEIWDLPCLDPAASTVPAAESLAQEIEIVRQWEDSRS